MYLYYYSQDGCGQIILRRRVGCDTIKTGIENARKRGKTMKTNVSQAIMEMIQYESGNPQRINHFLKVHSFAKAIGEMEGLDERTLNILEMASVMHDIGIKPSLIKYHSSSGRHQQVEGPRLLAYRPSPYHHGCGENRPSHSSGGGFPCEYF